MVSNACGTLWNLSARDTRDQRTLWELGAVPMLRSLVHSKHKMISMGSSAALKNLLAAMPEADLMDRGSRGESDAAKMYHSNLRDSPSLLCHSPKTSSEENYS